MNLRPARREDASALAALEALQPRAAGWGEAGFSGELAQSCAQIWCACEQGEIVGFLALRTAADIAEILNVAVHPALARKGIGKALLAAALSALKAGGVRQVTLEAEKGNYPAEALYASAGFAELGLRSNFYGPGRHGRIWGKEL